MIERLSQLDPVDPAAHEQVPNRTALLETIDRSSRMAKDIKSLDTTQDPTKGASRNGWLVAVAAFIGILAVVGIGALVLRSEGSGDVAATGVETTTAPTTAVPSATEVVESMVALYNSGDVDAWLAAFTEDAAIVDGGYSGSSFAFRDLQTAHTAGSHWTLVSCDEVADRSTQGSTALNCRIAQTDDFGGRARVGPVEDDHRIVVTDDGLIESFMLLTGDSEFFLTAATFSRSFETWLEATYPEVHGSFGQWQAGMPHPEDMPEALLYVDEFVAQSDLYPLDG